MNGKILENGADINFGENILEEIVDDMFDADTNNDGRIDITELGEDHPLRDEL